MALTDLTGDMLAKIKNASNAGKESVDIRYSGLLEDVCEILKKEGFITNYKAYDVESKKFIKVNLRYGKNSAPAITDLKRISTPGLRQYRGYEELKSILGGVGISILSTSHGVITGKDARARKVGGEVICYVW